MSDVDRLARVLVEHRFVSTLGRCACGWKPTEFYWPNVVAEHQAEAVLASGVVVSADRVRALADEWAVWDDDDWAAQTTYRANAATLRSLLVEPATDAAPTGETQTGDEPPHEFTEDVADVSMCVCGIPALYHDAAVSLPEGGEQR